MSLFERLSSVTEAKNPMTFSSMPGTDAFTHTDRWRGGRRNNSPAPWFVDRVSRRYPLWQQRASAAGDLRAAEMHADHGFLVSLAKRIRANKALNMCPSVLPECPPKRDHGKGGPDESSTDCHGAHCDVAKTKPDHGGKYPWPFNKDGDKKWDKDWTALGHQKGSSPGSHKGNVKKATKKANVKTAQKQMAGQQSAALKKQLKSTKFGTLFAKKAGLKKALGALKAQHQSKAAAAWAKHFGPKKGKKHEDAELVRRPLMIESQ